MITKHANSFSGNISGKVQNDAFKFAERLIQKLENAKPPEQESIISEVEESIGLNEADLNIILNAGNHGLANVWLKLFEVTQNKRFLVPLCTYANIEISTASVKFIAPDLVILNNLFTLLSAWVLTKDPCLLPSINKFLIKLVKCCNLKGGKFQWRFLNSLSLQQKYFCSKKLNIVLKIAADYYSNETFHLILNNLHVPTYPNNIKKLFLQQNDLSCVTPTQLNEYMAFIKTEAAIYLRSVDTSIICEEGLEKFIKNCAQTYHNDLFTLEFISCLIYRSAFEVKGDAYYGLQASLCAVRIIKSFERSYTLKQFPQYKNVLISHAVNVAFKGMKNDLFIAGIYQGKQLTGYQTWPGISMSPPLLYQLILTTGFERTVLVIRERYSKNFNLLLSEIANDPPKINNALEDFIHHRSEVDVKFKMDIGSIYKLEKTCKCLVQKLMNVEYRSTKKRDLRSMINDVSDVALSSMFLCTHCTSSTPKIRFNGILKAYQFTFSSFSAIPDKTELIVYYDIYKRQMVELLLDPFSVMLVHLFKAGKVVSTVIKKVLSYVIFQDDQFKQFNDLVHLRIRRLTQEGILFEI